MKRGLTILLQIAVVAIGIVTLGLMLWEPQIEGRNVGATLFEIYFNDPFLAYVYVGSIPFFVALYHAFKLLGLVGMNQTHSERSIKAVRSIKYCALTLAVFILGAEAFIVLIQTGSDDIAGGVVMGLVLLVLSLIIAAAAWLFERRIQRKILAG